MNILIATDGKKHSERAAEFVGNLFSQTKPEIDVIHVHPDDREPEETLDQAEGYLVRVEKILNSQGLEVKQKILRQGSIVDEILKQSKSGKYDLLVVGSQRLSSVITGLSESFLEDEYQELAKNLKTSLLIVKDSTVKVKRVLLCTDGSKIAKSMIEFWGELNQKHQPEVTILNIIPSAFVRFSDQLDQHKDEFLKTLTTFEGPRTKVIEQGKNILKEHGVEARAILREKKYAAEEILEEERDGDYDLVVMGYRGKNHRDRDVLGSQSLEVAKKSRSSVYIYKPKKISNK